MNTSSTPCQRPTDAGARPGLRLGRTLARRLATATLAALLAGGAHAETTRHVVQPGETLWRIAQEQLGQGARWTTLQGLNRLDSPGLIRPGQVLRLPATASPATALAEHVQGEVQVRLPRQTRTEVLRPRMSLPEGTRLEVGPEATARLNLPDGAAVDLAPGTRLRLDRLRLDPRSQRSQTLLRMDSGRIDSEVPPQRPPGSRFEIHTPSAVASVRGTRFGIAAGPDHASSDVSEGLVALAPVPAAKGPAGQEVLLRAGEGGHLGPDGRIDRAPLLDAPALASLPTRFGSGERMAFELPAQPGAHAYRLRLLEAPAGQHVLREAPVPGPRVEWPALPDGRYLLAVQGVDARGLPGRVATHGFTVQGAPAGTAAPHWQTGDGQPVQLGDEQPIRAGDAPASPSPHPPSPDR